MPSKESACCGGGRGCGNGILRRRGRSFNNPQKFLAVLQGQGQDLLVGYTRSLVVAGRCSRNQKQEKAQEQVACTKGHRVFSGIQDCATLGLGNPAVKWHRKNPRSRGDIDWDWASDFRP
jgi:hypothetical protein